MAVRRNRRRGLWAALALALALDAAAATGLHGQWAPAVLDHTDTGLHVLVVHDAEGRMYLRQLDLALLELRADVTPILRFEDERYVPAAALVTHRAEFDEHAGRLYLLPRPADARAPASIAEVGAAPGTPTMDVLPPAPEPEPEPEPERDPARESAPMPGSEPEPESAERSEPAGPAQPAEPGSDELLLDVIVNHQAIPGIWLARREEDELWLEADMLAAAGLHAPPGHEGAAEVPLSALAGKHYALDEARLVLDMTVPAELFQGRSIGIAGRHVPGPPPADFSAIVGYDLSASHSDGQTSGGALVDVSLARGRSSCTTAHTWRHGIGSRRLDSNCRVDWPERMLSLQVGDSATRPTRLQPGVRYTGLRLGTDFALNPYFRSLPDLAIQGSARLPSTLDIWIDDQLALRTALPPGPFDVHDIPADTGSGELRAVVTDVLGRQTVITVPVFVDPNLLKPGLLEWAAEAGTLRLSHGLGSTRAGAPFGAFAARRGMRPGVTADMRVEGHEHGGTAGLGGVWQVGGRSLLEFGAAASHHARGDGQAWHLGLTHRGEWWSFGVRQTRHSRDFTSLAWLAPGDAPARSGQAHLGLRLGRAQLNLGFVERSFRADDPQRFAHAGLNLIVLQWINVALSISHRLDQSDGTSFGIHVMLPLDVGMSTHVGVHDSGRGIETTAGVRRQAPVGPGVGWRAAARNGPDGQQVEGEGVWRSAVVETRLGASSGLGPSYVHGSVSGSVIAGQGRLYAARREHGSYALVQAGVPGVRVFRDNQVVAVTDADGRAMVPGLRPFQLNPVHLSVEDLPLSTRIERDRLDIVPGHRQAVRADFSVSRVRWLHTRLQRADGSHVPAGVLVRVEGGTEPGFVGYDGEVFLEVPDTTPVRMEARWDSQACSASADLGATGDIVEIDVLHCVSGGR